MPINIGIFYRLDTEAAIVRLARAMDTGVPKGGKDGWGKRLVKEWKDNNKVRGEKRKSAEWFVYRAAVYFRRSVGLEAYPQFYNASLGIAQGLYIGFHFDFLPEMDPDNLKGYIDSVSGTLEGIGLCGGRVGILYFQAPARLYGPPRSLPRNIVHGGRDSVNWKELGMSQNIPRSVASVPVPNEPLADESECPQ